MREVPLYVKPKFLNQRDLPVSKKKAVDMYTDPTRIQL